jgi:hypothetical protein
VPRSSQYLQKYGITHILSLTNQRDRPTINDGLGIQQLHVDIEDNPFEDLLMTLEGLCDWIDDALHSSPSTSKLSSNSVSGASADEIAHPPSTDIGSTPVRSLPNPTVLVHCLQGISRSGAIIVAYLMRTKSMDYDSALALARKSRSIIMPNSGFADQLRLWGQMDYTIYASDDASDVGMHGGERKTKARYEDWRANRGILLSKGEEAKQEVLRKSMADMAAAFGKRRMQMKGEDA